MKIVRLRKSQGLTQGRLAELCETTQQQIAKIENGIVDPRLSTLRKLSRALGCDLGDLFFSEAEFVDAVNRAVTDHQMNLKKCEMVDLNSLCSSKTDLPAFHPFWESLKICRKRNRVLFSNE